MFKGKYKYYYFDFDKNADAKSLPVYRIGEDKGATLAPKDHRIKAGDRIVVRFLNNFSITEGVTITHDNGEMNFLIDPEGKASLPIVGRVRLEGLNRREAALRLEALYGNYLVNPLIEVNILGLTVDVWGEVRAPGVYELLADRTTMIEVLSRAGGIMPYGRRDEVRIVRTTPGGKKELLVFDFTKFETLNAEEMFLQDKDIIIVEPRKIKVFGDNVLPYSSLISVVTSVTSIALFIVTVLRTSNQ